MIVGEEVILRARIDDDVAILREELYNDVSTRSRSDSRPWRPVATGAGTSPEQRIDHTENADFFSVVTRVSGELAGEAILWGVDSHNRVAHLGISLRPSFRGRGLGTDVVRTLCHYGFRIRGMNRLQIETLTSNAAMIAAAHRIGFVTEGVLRDTAWVEGEFTDQVVMGLLASEWAESH